MANHGMINGNVDTINGNVDTDIGNDNVDTDNGKVGIMHDYMKYKPHGMRQIMLIFSELCACSFSV